MESIVKVTSSAPAPFYYFEPKSMESFANARHEAYAKAHPFPHIVIENFLPEPVLDVILNEFVGMEAMHKEVSGLTVHNKAHLHDETVWPPSIRLLMYNFNSGPFLRFLGQLTGIDGLMPDPFYSGGGLHQTVNGGFLKIHADYNVDRRTNLDRRLNLLLYLNKDWKEEYGGHLELWEKDMSKAVVRIAPKFNTCVIFSTSDSSFHGHPDPLKCGDLARRSLALYYYSNGRPEEEKSAPHTTLYKARPGEDLKREKLARLGITEEQFREAKIAKRLASQDPQEMKRRKRAKRLRERTAEEAAQSSPQTYLQRVWSAITGPRRPV